jgi:hypothetical protein
MNFQAVSGFGSGQRPGGYKSNEYQPKQNPHKRNSGATGIFFTGAGTGIHDVNLSGEKQIEISNPANLPWRHCLCILATGFGSGQSSYLLRSLRQLSVLRCRRKSPPPGKPKGIHQIGGVFDLIVVAGLGEK